RLFLLAYDRFQSSYVRIFFSKIVGYFVTKCRGYRLRCIYKTLSFWSAFVTSIYILLHRFTTQRNCSVITKYNVNKHFIISMYLCRILCILLTSSIHSVILNCVKSRESGSRYDCASTASCYCGGRYSWAFNSLCSTCPGRKACHRSGTGGG